MTNLSWIRPHTCGSGVSLISGVRGRHNSITTTRNVHCDHFRRISYDYYSRPWWNYHSHMYTQQQQQQQIAQFCKKTKKLKETALTNTISPTNTGAIATSTASTTTTEVNAATISSTKTIRRKKKDQRTTNQNGESFILIPLPEHHQHSNIRSSSSSSSSSLKSSRNAAPTASSDPSVATANISSTNAIPMTSVYVHPLSQIVLQCLQTNCHEWVQSKNLHINLKIHGDGTFVTESTAATMAPLKSQRPTVMIVDDSIVDSNPSEKSNIDSTDEVEMMMNQYNHSNRNTIKIWTTYEKEERKHWLCASVAANHNNRNTDTVQDASLLLQNRYMLQDNSLTPWQSHSKVRGSIPERIQSHVIEMIHAINDICEPIT